MSDLTEMGDDAITDECTARPDKRTVRKRLDYLLALAEDYDDLSIHGLIYDVALTGQRDMAIALAIELARRNEHAYSGHYPHCS